MIFWFLLIVFIISLLIFIFYNSHNFQIFIRTKLKKQIISIDLLTQTQGKYLESGYFSSKHKIIEKSEYGNLLKRQKVNLTPCYSILTFKTVDAEWELFFTLVKELGQFKEYLILKCYSNNFKIHSKVAVEKIHSKLEIYSNNHSLMQILNRNSTQNILSPLLTIHEETLNIGHKYIQFKTMSSKEKLSKPKILQKISDINEIKNLIYISGLKPY